MELNNQDHVVKELMTIDKANYNEIELSTHFVCKDKNKDNYYFSKSVEIDDSITNFLKEHIIKKLKDYIFEDNNFAVQDYNHEFTISGYIGRFKIDSIQPNNIVVKNLDLLRKSISKDELENINKSNFQIITLTLNSEKVSFCFYKSIKRQGKSKKRAIFSSGEFKAINNELAEFGGNFSFFMDEKNIYILDPKQFEWAFDYKDHIARKSEVNMNKLTSMDFFPDEETKKAFKSAASHHLLVRGVASMEDNIINEVDKYFEARVEELKVIRDKKQSISDEESLNKFKLEIGELDYLINYIDFDNKKIIFKEKDNPTPLLHFFQDKIVESFLTKKIKIAMGIG
jgi:hypothetical protein